MYFIQRGFGFRNGFVWVAAHFFKTTWRLSNEHRAIREPLNDSEI
jgi:hypothetical protein